MSRTVFVTGATGLVGKAVLQQLLQDPSLSVYALARDPAMAARTIAQPRVTILRGDITQHGLGLDAHARAHIRNVDAVVHSAANTSFAQTRAEATALNVMGTRNVLDVFANRAGRFVLVSTAFVAGRRSGLIVEESSDGTDGWVNAYEESKHEAERLVRAHAADWLVLRPSTIVCDDASGRVTQLNAVHRGMHIYYRGLAAMMPGGERTLVDMVPLDYVARAIAQLTLARDVGSRTLHLCAGEGALPLGELLDIAYAVWQRAPAWRRRSLPRPSLTGLETYRLFERTVEQTGDVRLQRVIRSLSHFMPQLAYPKIFDTTGAVRMLDMRAPEVRTFWPLVLEHLLQTHWRGGELETETAAVQVA